MVAVGQFLTQTMHPMHIFSDSKHFEHSCIALISEQASGFTALTFPLLSSKTDDGQVETHIPQPSHNFRLILTLDPFLFSVLSYAQPSKHF
jgi:hypothetical protein